MSICRHNDLNDLTVVILPVGIVNVSSKTHVICVAGFYGNYDCLYRTFFNITKSVDPRLVVLYSFVVEVTEVDEIICSAELTETQERLEFNEVWKPVTNGSFQCCAQSQFQSIQFGFKA